MIKRLFTKLKKPKPDASPADSQTPVDSSEHSVSSISDDSHQSRTKKASDNQSAKTNTSAKAKKPTDGKNSSRKSKPKKAVEEAPWDPSQFPVAPAEGKTRFHDLQLPDPLLHAIADLGFEYCSPIQAQSLPFALDGQDVTGKAQTGTGKTAAFLITVIDELLNFKPGQERFLGEPRALVLAPTRELAIQIANDAEDLLKYTPLNVATLVGGMDYDKQQRQLNNQIVDLLVATPGRLMDFQSRGDVHLDQVEILVIDEADRMLDMGFIPQVRRIVRATPKREYRQTLLFSATFTPEVLSLTEQWTLDAQMVEIAPERVTTDTVEQRVYLVPNDDKYTILYNILKQPGTDRVMVFANRRDEVRRLAEKLERHDFRCGMLSGEVAQAKRVKTLEKFRAGSYQVLVATDVAGRGIHIDGVSHVVNFTLPEDPEDYVHRIGRTGRAGATGVSISFACEDDSFLLPDIEALIGMKLGCVQPEEELLATTPPLGPRRPGADGDRQRSGGGRRGGGHGGGRDRRGGGGHRSGGSRSGAPRSRR